MGLGRRRRASRPSKRQRVGEFRQHKEGGGLRSAALSLFVERRVARVGGGAAAGQAGLRVRSRCREVVTTLVPCRSRARLGVVRTTATTASMATGKSRVTDHRAQSRGGESRRHDFVDPCAGSAPTAAPIGLPRRRASARGWQSLPRVRPSGEAACPRPVRDSEPSLQLKDGRSLLTLDSAVHCVPSFPASDRDGWC